MTLTSRLNTNAAVLTLALAGLVPTALAQNTPAPAAQAQPASASVSGNPARDNLFRLQRPISFEFNEARLEDVIAYIAKETGAAIEPIWSTGVGGEGLDKEATVTMTVKDVDALSSLEKVLDAVAQGTGSDSNTWQFSTLGVVQVGPRKSLNKFKRVEIYDVNDLLFEIPVFDDVPKIDLAQVLQGGSGGGSSSPFSGSGGNRNDQRSEEREEKRRKRISEIQNLITSTVEIEQWATQGGDGGTISTYEGHFIVNAPDYMHRALVGYSWWPSRSVSQRGKRYVSLNVDVGNSILQTIENFPVSATGGGGGGGGGGTPGGGR